jgi:hypothetical protein
MTALGFFFLLVFSTFYPSSPWQAPVVDPNISIVAETYLTLEVKRLISNKSTAPTKSLQLKTQVEEKISEQRNWAPSKENRHEIKNSQFRNFPFRRRYCSKRLSGIKLKL